MQSKCITKNTTVALAGGEFLLHPDAKEIMKWFRAHHKNFDLLTNSLRPDLVIESVSQSPPGGYLFHLMEIKKLTKT
ncbi:MAG: hypothetical protein IPH18_16310 [Chitinophagaceae bacterium]|nr:hypothetical protein [Chitinophagaceae bacterium]